MNYLSCVCCILLGISSLQLHIANVDAATHASSSSASSPFSIDLVLATLIRPDALEIAMQRKWMEAQLEEITTPTYQPLTLTEPGKHSRRYVIKHFFVVCVGEHGLSAADILVLDCTESYQLLYTKTMAYFKAIMDLVPGARYYGKRDADAFPCFTQLLPVCDRAWADGITSQYVGALACNSPVRHDPTHRWYDRVMNQLTPHQHTYWPYHEGSFVLLSADLLGKVMRNKEHLQGYYMEDAMIGAWVVGLEKHFVHMSYTHTCDYNSTSDIYHYCKHNWQVDAVLEKQRQRCFTVAH